MLRTIRILKREVAPSLFGYEYSEVTRPDPSYLILNLFSPCHNISTWTEGLILEDIVEIYEEGFENRSLHPSVSFIRLLSVSDFHEEKGG